MCTKMQHDECGFFVISFPGFYFMRKAREKYELISAKRVTGQARQKVLLNCYS